MAESSRTASPRNSKRSLDLMSLPLFSLRKERWVKARSNISWFLNLRLRSFSRGEKSVLVIIFVFHDVAEHAVDEFGAGIVAIFFGDFDGFVDGHDGWDIFGV